MFREGSELAPSPGPWTTVPPPPSRCLCLGAKPRNTRAADGCVHARCQEAAWAHLSIFTGNLRKCPYLKALVTPAIFVCTAQKCLFTPGGQNLSCRGTGSPSWLDALPETKPATHPHQLERPASGALEGWIPDGATLIPLREPYQAAPEPWPEHVGTDMSA